MVVERYLHHLIYGSPGPSYIKSLIYTLCKLPIYIELIFYYRLYWLAFREVFAYRNLLNFKMCGCILVIVLGCNFNTFFVYILISSLLSICLKLIHPLEFLNFVSMNIHQLETNNKVPDLPKYQLTSEDEGIVTSKIKPFFVLFVRFFIIIDIIFEIVSCFFIFLYSTPVAPSVIVDASMYALVRRPAENSKEIYFIWKALFTAFKANFVYIVIQSVQFDSLPKERQRRYWNFINFLVIVLCIIDTSYQFTISFSFIVISIVVFISAFFIFKRSVSAYIATSLIVLFLVLNILWYELWTVGLFSVPVAEFLSQFTIVGSLWYAVGLNYPNIYKYF